MDLDLLIDLHRYNKRQGPGSSANTLLALQMIGSEVSSDWSIADIGCGTGAQTLDLARLSGAQIKALDLFPEFLQELDSRAAKQGLDSQIQSMQGDMHSLPFLPESLDLIWSEGAIYNMGFANGLRNWIRYLKPGAYLAVSEIIWTQADRPAELTNFWMKEYPEIGTREEKVQVLEENGFAVLNHFCLDRESWLQNYYEPLEASIPDFLERNHQAKAAQDVATMHRSEHEFYLKNQEYYSYGFFIAKKK